jgi:hypothetical protein
MPAVPRKDENGMKTKRPIESLSTGEKLSRILRHVEAAKALAATLPPSDDAISKAVSAEIHALTLARDAHDKAKATARERLKTVGVPVDGDHMELGSWMLRLVR